MPLSTFMLQYALYTMKSYILFPHETNENLEINYCRNRINTAAEHIQYAAQPWGLWMYVKRESRRFKREKKINFEANTRFPETNIMPEFKDYTIGWIVSQMADFMAARRFFDVKHKQEDWLDNSHYVMGSIGVHNVVIAYGIPRIGISDVASFAATSADMLQTFPNIKLCVIGGAGFTEDFKATSVRLGDIAMGTPTVDANYLSFKPSIPEKNREIARALIIASDSFKSNFSASVEEIIIKHVPAESPLLVFNGDQGPGIVATPIMYIGGDAYSDLPLEEKVDMCCSGMEVNSKVPCIKVMGMRGYSIVDYGVTGWEDFATMMSAAFIHGMLRELPKQS